MVDPEARAFGRKLTVILSILGVLTAGSVLLFGHLLFKALRKDVVEDALVRSRLDAERIALGVSQRAAGGDLYTLKYKQQEIDNFVGSTLSERQVLNEVQVLDKNKKVLYSFGSVLKSPQPQLGGSQETGNVSVTPGGSPTVKSRTDEIPIQDPYAIEVPIGDLFVLRAGVSRKELEGRVEKLRRQLYMRTAAAAVVSLLGIVAASTAVILLFRRTRMVEAAHIEAERRAELGEVAAGLAHEIRNPLNAMGLNLELLEEQLDRTGGKGSASELAQAARVETGRLAKLLTDFLAYARPTPVVPQKADLNDPAAEAVSFLKREAEERRIRLTFAPHAGGAPAKLDEARIKQVVLNLVANALDAVEAVGATSREVDVAIGEADGMWRLTVQDRGPGVPKARHSEIFRAFVSTKPAGTGLGLPIAERIVKAHGGTLTLESKPGEPTRAVATIPKA
jgi:signal transduction histidine kinase